VAGRAEIFLTGANGSVGKHFAAAALSAGFRVKGLVLPGEDARMLERLGVSVQRGRLEDRRSMEIASQGTTHAVHCASLLPHLSAMGRTAFERVNVDAPREMVRLGKERGWKRTIFLSSCGVLGRETTGPTTDETPYRRPFDLYTWSKIEGEKAVVEETSRLGVHTVLIRPANVYGPGMLYKWPEVFELTSEGRMKTIGGGRVPFAVVHVRDLARAILAALDEDRPISQGERILVSSPEELTFGEVLAIVAEKLGAPKPGNVPYVVALTAAYVARGLPPPLRLGRLKLLDPSAVREYRLGSRFDTSHAERALGFRAQERFDRGIAEAIAAWREQFR